MTSIRTYITNTSLYQGAANTLRSMQKLGIDMMPHKVIENPKIINGIEKIGKEISSAEQRVILGASALMSQPFIDAHNKDVDDETRKVSVARTVAKIIAGTLTGYAVRKGCIKAIDAFSQIPAKGVPKYKTIFTPKIVNDNTTEFFKQYKNTMGTLVALGVMLFTNFLIDAPLTKYLTNLFVSKQEEKQHDKHA